MDVTNFLVAFGLLIFVLGSLRRIKTFLEVLKGLIEIVLFLELRGNNLIDSY